LKSNSHSKALQSWELADSIQNDVIESLKKLKVMQDQEAQEIQQTGEQLIKSLKQKIEEVKMLQGGYQNAAKRANVLAEDCERQKKNDNMSDLMKEAA